MTAIPVAAGELVGVDYLNEAFRGHWRAAGTLDVVNTLTETSIAGGGLTITANAMSTTRALIAFLIGDYLNNTGAGQTFTPRLKFGGTTFYGHARSVAASATRYPIFWVFALGNLGVANSNFLAGLMANPANVGPNAGSVAGILQSGSVDFFASNGAVAIDTTANQTFDLSVQHGAANALLSFRRHSLVVGAL